jgi:hypothetical protein
LLVLREQASWIWCVVNKIKPEYADAVRLAPKPEHFYDSSFYHHTKLGWLEMPENF